ncbi:MAG: hypothetical protein WBL53_08910 [Pseudonocardiaceae bacterium]
MLPPVGDAVGAVLDVDEIRSPPAMLALPPRLQPPRTSWHAAHEGTPRPSGSSCALLVFQAGRLR